MKNLKYCSNFWFIYSICLFVCEWNTVDNLISIFNILFNSFINFAANRSSLSLITLSGNLCNFHILSLNNLVNSSTDVFFVVATKYAIFDNLLHITYITFFSATNSKLVIKLTIKYAYAFSSTLTFSLVPLFYFSSPDINHIPPYIFQCPLLLPATSNFLLPTLSSSIYPHVLLLVHHDITR